DARAGSAGCSSTCDGVLSDGVVALGAGLDDDELPLGQLRSSGGGCSVWFRAVERSGLLVRVPAREGVSVRFPGAGAGSGAGVAAAGGALGTSPTTASVS